MALKLPTEETHYFDYAWPPFTQSPCDLEWMGLAEHQVTYPHLQVSKERKRGERGGEGERERGRGRGRGGKGEGEGGREGRDRRREGGEGEGVELKGERKGKCDGRNIYKSG